MKFMTLLGTRVPNKIKDTRMAGTRSKSESKNGAKLSPLIFGKLILVKFQHVYFV